MLRSGGIKQVVDTDGKEGMKGHVYAKFGQQIARVAIAGFLEGLGSAMTLGQQQFTYGVNTGVRSGQFKDTDADTLAKAGFGGSFSELDLPPELKGAVIVHRGELTPDYRYLEAHLAAHEG